MKTTLTATAAVLMTLGFGAASEARGHDDGRLVRAWYRDYLNRSADCGGLAAWTKVLRCSGPEAVQAGLLGSEEYYCLHGHTAHGFVAGLYGDVLGRAARCDEIEHWVCQLRRCGCRVKLATSFLCAARAELAGRYAPPPVGTVIESAYRAYEPGGVQVRVRYSYGR